jgi:Bacterial regulatory proteins, tetR family
MEFQLKFTVNDKIFIRDPEGTETGKQIVKTSIDLIYVLGFEHFTFKKLAMEIGSTEATIYRYFENKHRILLYIMNWYWSYLEFLVDFKLQNVVDKKVRLKLIVDLLTNDLPESMNKLDYNKKLLSKIVISESSKSYLVKDVTEINKNAAFKPYKDLCTKIADVIKAYSPKYKYPRSLSTTIIESSHQQQYFSEHLPRLTDVSASSKSNFTRQFLTDLLFKTLS